MSPDEKTYHAEMRRASQRFEAVVNACLEEGRLDLSDLTLVLVYLGRSAAGIVKHNLSEDDRAAYSRMLDGIEAGAETLADEVVQVDSCLKPGLVRVPVMFVKPAQA